MLGPTLDCEPIDGRPLRLVPTEERHLDACQAWLNDPAINPYLSLYFGLSRADEAKWFERARESREDVYWAIEVGETHVGQTAIMEIDWIARTGVTGILIGDRGFWKRGVATAVMNRRAAYAFESLNLEALFTEIFEPNEGSLRAALKAGYREYGRKPFAKYLNGAHLTSWLGVLSRVEWTHSR